MRISVVTNDRYLFRLAELLLFGEATVTDSYDEGADVIIHDLDSGFTLPETGARVISVSREANEGAETLPISRQRLKDLVFSGEKKPPLSLSQDGKGAILKGRYIKLTAHEFSLLALLIKGGEKYTTREEISKGVWADASDGLINIYVHYLREKLETDGEKVIVSSRKYGYRINPAYLGVQGGTPEGEVQKGAHRDHIN